MLKAKVALVTGASSGIGRATALAFSREGASVVVSDINVEHGQETASLIRAHGGKVVFVAADVGKPHARGDRQCRAGATGAVGGV